MKSAPAPNQTTDPLGALRRWSDAAARSLGCDPARWSGYDFAGIEGEGMYVTGRVGRFGRSRTVFVSTQAMEKVDAR